MPARNAKYRRSISVEPIANLASTSNHQPNQTTPTCVTARNYDFENAVSCEVFDQVYTKALRYIASTRWYSASVFFL